MVIQSHGGPLLKKRSGHRHAEGGFTRELALPHIDFGLLATEMMRIWLLLLEPFV